MDNQNKTKVDRIIKEFKNNWLGVIIILGLMVVTGISKFLDSLDRIEAEIFKTEIIMDEEVGESENKVNRISILGKDENIQTKEVSYIEFYVILNSDMLDAKILIDDEPAQIIEDNQIIKKIRIKQKDSPVTIKITNGKMSCIKTQKLMRNQKVKLC